MTRLAAGAEAVWSESVEPELSGGGLNPDFLAGYVNQWRPIVTGLPWYTWLGLYDAIAGQAAMAGTVNRCGQLRCACTVAATARRVVSLLAGGSDPELPDEDGKRRAGEVYRRTHVTTAREEPDIEELRAVGDLTWQMYGDMFDMRDELEFRSAPAVFLERSDRIWAATSALVEGMPVQTLMGLMFLCGMFALASIPLGGGEEAATAVLMGQIVHQSALSVARETMLVRIVGPVKLTDLFGPDVSSLN